MKKNNGNDKKKASLTMRIVCYVLTAIFSVAAYAAYKRGDNKHMYVYLTCAVISAIMPDIDALGASHVLFATQLLLTFIKVGVEALLQLLQPVVVGGGTAAVATT